MSIFKSQRVLAASGKELHWIIDCDDFTDAELGVFAKLIIAKYPNFWSVTHPTSHYGSCVPRLATAIASIRGSIPASQGEYVLIVDDVLTTGQSMEQLAQGYRTKRTWNDQLAKVVGAVIFARDVCPPWITPLFTMEKYLYGEVD